MNKRRPRCQWCGKRLDSKRHRDITENLCFIRHEKAIRSQARPKVKSLSNVYDGDHIRPEFIGTDMEDKLMQRQRSMAVDALLGLSRNGYKVPKNVEFFLQGGFVWNQVAQRRPWAVYVLITTPKGTTRKRKRFNNLYEAVAWHSKIHPKYPSSGIVSLAHQYELPAEWRVRKDKLPNRFKWCPHCGTFRVFKIKVPRETFSVLKKVWRPSKDKYDWVERTVAVIECQLCGHNNRSPVYRRSNQPWEVRRIKKGVRRVKPRVRTARGKKARADKRSRTRRR
jgi:Zn ribbon nucleic-acid-binding protein